jgi:hypothetical protein
MTPKVDTVVLPPGRHIPTPEERSRVTRSYVTRNKLTLHNRKFEKGCDRCGYKGEAIYFIQPDGERSCAQDLYVSEKLFLKKLHQATALCYNCRREAMPPKVVRKRSCKVVHSTPTLAKLASDDPKVAALVQSLGLRMIDPFAPSPRDG